MASRDGEKYISAAIESILQQSYENFEFIIIDDYSSDKTWGIIKSYSRKDERIIPIRNKKPLGVGGSANKAIKIAKGKYLLRMDSDDWSFPYRIEKQVQFMENNPEVVCSGGYLVNCDKNLKEKGVRKYPLSHKELLKTILRWNPVPHPASIWRKSAVDKTSGYPTTLDTSSDYAFTLAVSKHGKIANIGIPLIKYRIHGASLSNAKMRKQQLATIYLSYKGEIEYGYESRTKDHIWRIIQVVTLYTIPTKIKRFFFNLLIAKTII